MCEWFWSSRGGPSCPSAMTQQRMSVAQAGNEEGVWLFRLCWSHDLWSKWSNVLNLLRCQQTCQMRTANARLDDSVALWSQAGTREPGWYSWQASALAIHGNIRNTRKLPAQVHRNLFLLAASLAGDSFLPLFCAVFLAAAQLWLSRAMWYCHAML